MIEQESENKKREWARQGFGRMGCGSWKAERVTDFGWRQLAGGGGGCGRKAGL